MSESRASQRYIRWIYDGLFVLLLFFSLLAQKTQTRQMTQSRQETHWCTLIEKFVSVSQMGFH